MIKPAIALFNCVTTLVFVFPQVVAAQTSDVAAEISREWKKLSEDLDLDGVISIHRKESGNQFVAKADEEYQVKLLGINELSIDTNFLDDSRNVRGINDTYVFELSARNDSRFVLDEVHELAGGDESVVGVFQRGRQYRQRHPSLEFFMAVNWRNVLASKGISVTTSRDIEWHGKSALEVILNCEPSDEEFDPRIKKDQSKFVPKIRNCRVVFLKDVNFLPAEWECELKFFSDADFTPIHVALNYDFASFDVPFPIKRTMTRNCEGENDVETKEYSYDFKRPDKREFYLSAFGLPEPHFVRKSWSENVHPAAIFGMGGGTLAWVSKGADHPTCCLAFKNSTMEQIMPMTVIQGHTSFPTAI